VPVSGRFWGTSSLPGTSSSKEREICNQGPIREERRKILRHTRTLHRCMLSGRKVVDQGGDGKKKTAFQKSVRRRELCGVAYRLWTEGKNSGGREVAVEGLR